MTDSQKSNGRPSPDEYRRALLRQRRRTMRTVRNTLLAVAILAGLWFLVLLARERMTPNQISPPTISEDGGEMLSSPDPIKKDNTEQ